MRKKCRSDRRPRGALVSIMAASLVGLAGCRSQSVYQGEKHDIEAKYQFRRLKANLPGSVRVPAAIAAAEDSLRSRGYAIRSSMATEDKGRVDAAPPEAGLFEEVVVMAEAVGSETRIEILIEPTGDQTRSRAIMDGILTRLGL